MKTRTVQVPDGSIVTSLAPHNEGPLYGVLTLRKRAHKSAFITDIEAPVSTRAVTRIPSTTTDNMFFGRSGGIVDIPRNAVSPRKTAGPSFPAVGWDHARPVEEATQPGGKVMVNGVAGFGSCEGDRPSQVERESGEWVTDNVVGGNHS